MECWIVEDDAKDVQQISSSISPPLYSLLFKYNNKKLTFSRENRHFAWFSCILRMVLLRKINSEDDLELKAMMMMKIAGL